MKLTKRIELKRRWKWNEQNDEEVRNTNIYDGKDNDTIVN